MRLLEISSLNSLLATVSYFLDTQAQQAEGKLPRSGKWRVSPLLLLSLVVSWSAPVVQAQREPERKQKCGSHQAADYEHTAFEMSQ